MQRSKRMLFFCFFIRQSTFWVKPQFQATNTNTYMTSKWCKIRMKTVQNVVTNRACKEQIQTKSNSDCCNSQKPYSAKLISAFPCGLHDMKMRCLITSQHRSRWIAFLSENKQHHQNLEKKANPDLKRKKLEKNKIWRGKTTTYLLEEKTHNTQIWKYFHPKNMIPTGFTKQESKSHKVLEILLMFSATNKKFWSWFKIEFYDISSYTAQTINNNNNKNDNCMRDKNVQRKSWQSFSAGNNMAAKNTAMNNISACWQSMLEALPLTAPARKLSISILLSPFLLGLTTATVSSVKMLPSARNVLNSWRALPTWKVAFVTPVIHRIK